MKKSPTRGKKSKSEAKRVEKPRMYREEKRQKVSDLVGRCGIGEPSLADGERSGQRE